MNRETLIEIAGWVVTVVAVGGVILNNRRRRECFWLWFISNTISAGIHASAGMVALTVRDLVFLVLAVQGLVLWTRAARRGEPAGKIEIRVTVTDRLTRALRRTIAILRKASPEAVVKCGACGEPVCIDPAEGVFHVIQCPACGATGEYDEYAEPAASERRSTVNAKRWWLGERWLWMWRESCGLIGP
ncbi:MAG: nicotinamide mononucleotide transporter, partial [Planctomycetes bacterium]|nr:nicotinamide mononucleotide transporter [Planctomycetota bacterium]